MNRLSALYGREAESRVISAALTAVRRGVGDSLLVTGPRGSGRTALLTEAMATAASHGVTVLTELPATGYSSPLTRIRDAANDLARRAAAGPLLVAVDDAHLRGDATLRALRTLPTRLAEAPIVWLLTSAIRPASPEARAAMAAFAELSTELRLAPLSGDAMLPLLRDLGGEGFAALAERCGGDPGLLVELVGAGVLTADDHLPPSVRQAVADRLEPLSPAARETLRAAATLPHRFRVDDLARALGRPPGTLWAPVAETIAEFLLVDHGGPLGFRQSVVRDVLAETGRTRTGPTTSVVSETTREAYRRFDWETTLARLDAQLAGDRSSAHWLLGTHRALFFGLAGWAEAGLDEAAAGRNASLDRGETAAAGGWEKVTIRLLWDAGRLREPGDRPMPPLDDPADGLDIALLDAAGRLALRSGDRAGHERIVAQAAAFEAAGHESYATVGPWLAALGTDDPREALRLANDVGLFARLELPAGTPFDAADQPRFVRIALAAGARADAVRAVELAEERAARSPRFTLLTAAATHARGLLEEDPAQLLGAAALYRETSRRLDTAAAWDDAARCGAEPAPRAAAPLGTGKPLTPSERRTVELIVAGATNREAAERLNLSPHTVNAQLRRAFAKLGVHSRVELIQLAASDHGIVSRDSTS